MSGVKMTAKVRSQEKLASDIYSLNGETGTVCFFV